MVDARSTAVADVNALIETVDGLQDQLLQARAAYGVVLERLSQKTTVRQALHDGDVSATRSSMTTAMERFETARRVSRISLVLADLAEGSSITSVSETWGISRQLVSRYVSAAEKGAATVTPAP